MMIIINRIGDTISGSVDGKQYGVSFDEAKYQKMLELQQKASVVQNMDELNTIVAEFIPLTQESYKELVETKSPYIMVNKHTNKFYLKYGNVVSSKPLPQIFVDRILKSIEKNIDITPLIKCWVRYLRPLPGKPAYSETRAKLFAEYIGAPYLNAAYSTQLMKEQGLSHEIANNLATTTQVAISQEGLLVCYKVSKEITKKFVKGKEDDSVELVNRYDYDVDEFTGLKTIKKPADAEDRVFEPAVQGQSGDAFWCDDFKGHIIKVGKQHKLDSWDQVDTRDGVAGVKGLHCGGLKYIAGYQNTGTETHNIFVDPMYIGAIVGLGNGDDGAMRVLQYFVHGVFSGVNRQIYHSSEYGKMTDQEYANAVEEVVKLTQEKIAETAAGVGEAKALSKVDASTLTGQATVSASDALDK